MGWTAYVLGSLPKCHGIQGKTKLPDVKAISDELTNAMIKRRLQPARRPLNKGFGVEGLRRVPQMTVIVVIINIEG